MWQCKVYKPGKDERHPSKMVVKEIFRMDNYQCQSCRKRFRVSELSCHHIVPRVQGGDNSPKNLVTLCKPCHDLIELNEVKTLEEIWGYKKKLDGLSEREIMEDEMMDEITTDNEGPIDWHSWVYGGRKRKQKGY